MGRALKVCTEPGCPAPVAHGRCPRHARPAWLRTVPVAPVGRSWRREVLAAADHMCAHCGGPATEADHIVPRHLAPHLACEVSNGQALCAGCHRVKTQAEANAWRTDAGAPPLPR